MVAGSIPAGGITFGVAPAIPCRAVRRQEPHFFCRILLGPAKDERGAHATVRDAGDARALRHGDPEREFAYDEGVTAHLTDVNAHWRSSAGHHSTPHRARGRAARSPRGAGAALRHGRRPGSLRGAGRGSDAGRRGRRRRVLRRGRGRPARRRYRGGQQRGPRTSRHHRVCQWAGRRGTRGPGDRARPCRSC